MSDSDIHSVCPMDDLIDIVDGEWISERLIDDQVDINGLLQSSLREVQLSLPGCTNEIVQRIALLGTSGHGTFSYEFEGFIDFDDETGNVRANSSGGGSTGGANGGHRANMNNSTIDNESVLYASLSRFDFNEDEDDEAEAAAMRRTRQANATTGSTQWNELDLDSFHQMFDGGGRSLVMNPQKRREEDNKNR